MTRLARKESEDRVKAPREKRGARARKGSKGREETSVERSNPRGRLRRQYSASQDCLVPGAEQRCSILTLSTPPPSPPSTLSPPLPQAGCLWLPLELCRATQHL